MPASAQKMANRSPDEIVGGNPSSENRTEGSEDCDRHTWRIFACDIANSPNLLIRREIAAVGKSERRQVVIPPGATMVAERKILFSDAPQASHQARTLCFAASA